MRAAAGASVVVDRARVVLLGFTGLAAPVAAAAPVDDRRGPPRPGGARRRVPRPSRLALDRVLEPYQGRAPCWWSETKPSVSGYSAA